MVLARTAACLAAALTLATAGEGFAQISPAVPARSEPLQTAVAQPRSDGERVSRRPKKRAQRTSRRRTASPVSPSLAPRRSLLDRGLIRHQLDLEANAEGGYDDSITGGVAPDVGGPPGPMARGSRGYVDATLSSYHGNGLRFVRLAATGNLRAYPGYLEEPALGGAASVAGGAILRRKTALQGSGRVGYEPLFSLFSQGAGAPLLPATIPDPTPRTGLYERRSLSSAVALSLDREWSKRDSTLVSGSYRTERFTDEQTGDNEVYALAGAFRRRLARGIGARLAYSHSTHRYTDQTGFVEPTREHRFEGGPEIERAFSRRTRLSVSLAGGASYLEAGGTTRRPALSSWLPVGSGTLALGLSSGWSVDGGYRRDFSLLRGVTDELYTTDTAFVTTGGPVTSGTRLQLGGVYSSWRESLGRGASDRFLVYGASAGMRFALSTTLAATIGYAYYHHRYSNPAALAPGFPAYVDRHAVSVGLRVRMPLRVSVERSSGGDIDATRP